MKKLQLELEEFKTMQIAYDKEVSLNLWLLTSGAEITRPEAASADLRLPDLDGEVQNDIPRHRPQAEDVHGGRAEAHVQRERPRSQLRGGSPFSAVADARQGHDPHPGGDRLQLQDYRGAPRGVQSGRVPHERHQLHRWLDSIKHKNVRGGALTHG